MNKAKPTIQVDGPHVMHKGDTLMIYYIDSVGRKSQLRTETFRAHDLNSLQLKVATDEADKFFTVKLRSKHPPAPSTHRRPKKMLVMSDIEGNFNAFRKLLQAAGAINDNFEWTFEDGSLVLVGDFVDRGAMVTEVLWLIYSLEEQAEAAKGKVHFILGNHEVMNMSGNLSYLNPRYHKYSAMIGVNYMYLLGPESELGRWMMSKNVVERIGNILFTHGGISGYMNRAQLPLEDLNHMSRPWYTDTTYEYPDKYVNLIFSEYGPMWYRGYYYGSPRATMDQVDSTLNIYQVRHITTGHTVIDSNIVSLYDGKLLNTDVHHASGHSEALLIEGRDMYRINARGEKLPVEPYRRR